MKIEWRFMPKNPDEGVAPFDGNPILIHDAKFYANVVRWSRLNGGFLDNHGAMVAYPAMWDSFGALSAASPDLVGRLSSVG